MNSGLNSSGQRESSRPGHEESAPSPLHSSSTGHNESDHNKPFKMNTYIQLDIDENNFNCLPRICKFVITRLKLDQELLQPSVILAVKLEASKRSLRTLEIPLQNQKADLNLLYNITYPHYLKKDTNLLYIYVQTRRKKYKTKAKTIQFGYKTLAYTFIDLANALQKPYSNELPLFLRTAKNNSKQQIIGYLTIQSLTSQPTNDYDTSDEIDFDLNSDMDSDNEHKKPSNNNNKTNKSQLTGKIISFIRKLKNENSSQHKSAQSTDQTIENEHSLIIDHVYDLDYDENEDLDYEFYKNIEQVSDYANSDSDEPNFLFKDQDAYSIVSTPKPKIEPFYSQNPVDSEENSLCLNFKRNYLIAEKPESIMDNYVVRKNFTIIEVEELGKSLSEQQLEYLLKNKTNVRIFLIGSDNSALRNYLRSFYLNLIKLNSDFSKIFQNIFIMSNDKQEILNYLIYYLNEENVRVSLSQTQIGQVMLHTENEAGKLVPFLSSVTISQNDEESVINCAKMTSLSTSSSLPQFLNLNANSHQSKLAKCNYSPPSSPLTGQENPDPSSIYNLQIDYWTSNCPDDTNIQEPDPNKTNLKALFKSVTIFRTNSANSLPDSNLTLCYSIKEKKQKSKFYFFIIYL